MINDLLNSSAFIGRDV